MLSALSKNYTLKKDLKKKGTNFMLWSVDSPCWVCHALGTHGQGGCPPTMPFGVLFSMLSTYLDRLAVMVTTSSHPLESCCMLYFQGLLRQHLDLGLPFSQGIFEEPWCANPQVVLHHSQGKLGTRGSASPLTYSFA